VETFNNSNLTLLNFDIYVQWRIQEAMVRLPPWSQREFLDYLCTVFCQLCNLAIEL